MNTIVGLMNSYAEALRSLDAERVTAFYADDPAFRVYSDGQGFTRDALSDAVTQMFLSLQRFEATWEEVEVTPLGSDAALGSSRFRRMLVNVAGEAVEDWGHRHLGLGSSGRRLAHHSWSCRSLPGHASLTRGAV